MVESADSFSSDQMVAELYAELRRLASAKMSKLAPGQTLQATALVHEAYLKLSREPSQRWENRGHFFASAAEAMRRILIDQVRRKAALRHGGNTMREQFEEINLHSPEPEERMMEVNECLQELEAHNQLQSQIVKLRFFAGLRHGEVASLLEISEKTVRRQWTFAKVWLYQKIADKNSPAHGRSFKSNTG
jgi:RNA polymerase sigma factor (TIGR02999 family)